MLRVQGFARGRWQNKIDVGHQRHHEGNNTQIITQCIKTGLCRASPPPASAHWPTTSKSRPSSATPNLPSFRLTALYRGHGFNLIREGMFTTVYLGLHDGIRPRVCIDDNHCRTPPLHLAPSRRRRLGRWRGCGWRTSRSTLTSVARQSLTQLRSSRHPGHGSPSAPHWARPSHVARAVAGLSAQEPVLCTNTILLY